MRRALVLATLLSLCCAGSARAQDCGPASTACYGPTVVQRDAAATCRHAGGPCQPEADVSGWGSTWTHRALSFQYALGNTEPLRDAPWIGTHNSFNSVAEMGTTLSDTDSNQQLSLTDQLAIDVRSLELDIHSFRGTQVVCHARGADEGHAGCSIEREVGPVVDEIATWLRAHRDQVLMLYVEDHLDNAADHDAATAAIRQSLGDLLYTPPQGAGCTKLPMSVSRADILAAGRQAIIVSDCGEGAAWQGTAFDWSAHVENGSPGAFRDFPDCGPDHTRAVYDATLVRYFEDSTWLSAAVGGGPEPGITPQIAAAMARCGVDLLGLDQLLPGDGRLDALVWSWARDEPRAGAGDCTVQRPDGRWEAGSCDERHPATCSDGAGGWLVTLKSARARDAAKLCAREGMTFAPPRTGYENALVRASSAGGTAWLNVPR